TIERMTVHYLTLLEAATEASETAVGALPVMPDAERQLILETWNATTTTVQPETLLHQLIAQQAAVTPHACAVRHGSRKMSFAELEAQAERLAKVLTRRGIGRGDRVGIRLQPSPGLLVAMIGVLKVGAAFVPLDPATPPARSDAMLLDCGAR